MKLNLISLFFTAVLSLTSCKTLAPVEDTSKGLVTVSVNMDGHVDLDLVRKFLVAQGEAAKIKPDAVIIRIDSGGGGVNEGLRIIQIMNSIKAPKVCIVDGEAASMAFVILQECDRRIMTRRSLLMFHKARMAGIEGLTFTEEELEEMNQYLALLNEMLLEEVQLNMNLTGEEIAEKIAKHDWWLGWREAKRVGAIDLVVADLQEALDNPFKETL